MRASIRPIDFLGILVSVSACLAALVVVLSPPDRQQDATADSKMQEAALGQLRAAIESASTRIGELEALRSNQGLQGKNKEGQWTGQAPEMSHVDHDPTRLASIEGRLARLENMRNHPRTAWIFPDEMVDADAARLARARDAYRATFLDATKPEVDRLEALEMLRRFPAEMDPADKAVLTEAVGLLDGDSGFVHKKQLISAMAGLVDPMLLPVFLNYVRGSNDPDLVQGGLQGLQGFPPSPETIAAIEAVIRNPPDAETALKARRILEDLQESKH